jgi:osmoprotectant transport system ATP-binding protein
VITLEHVSKSFAGGSNAVKDLSLDIAGGKTCVLIGPSGCGKTTTLRMINRLIDPDSGRILVDGVDTSTLDPVALRLKMGYVIQQTGLFPHMTVGQNVATVPRLWDWDSARVKARVEELLHLVGLDPKQYRDRYPHQLSGGQRQRVGFARALGADPPILLMDEPFGAVDRITRERLQQEFITIQRSLSKTVVFVTHDIDEAVKIGDRIALFNVGGVLAQVATPGELLAHPNSDFVAGFVGDGRLVRRLALISLRDVELAPTVEPPPALGVSADATLREALDVLLRSSDGRVAVSEGGRLIGMVDADVIRRASLEVAQQDRPSADADGGPPS